jgi:tight adherence protein C
METVLTPQLIALLVVALTALGMAAYAIFAMQRRSDLLRRATLDADSLGVRVLKKEGEGEGGWLQGVLERYAEREQVDDALQVKLTQAGFDTTTAPAYYFLLRVTSFVAFPVLTFLLIPRNNFLIYAMSIGVALFTGLILPMAALDRLVQRRQERLRRSVPDALDLMVVCVEAGVSLDAAILRVSREIRLAHPELAHELAVVNRFSNAGMPREQALRSLWQRTGVEDLRSLVSSLIQSEKWGTSVATVLRVSAETLRRKRRQAAEKQAKMAPLKMTFPLLFFILPALFVVILGPAVVQIIREFSKV